MIDEEITFREKGYRSTDLSPCSYKPVYAVCEGENCNYGRWVEKRQYRDLCYECAMKKSRKYDYDDDIVRSIDEEKTFASKGYRSTDLSARSHKEVYAICIECGNGRWLSLCEYSDLCVVCGNKKNRKYSYDDLECVVRSIDEKKTYEERGYRSTDLSAQSGKEVYAICIECKNGRWINYQSYHDLCHNCAISKNVGENNPNWKGGISIGDYCKLFDEPLKDAIRKYFNNMCFECGGDIYHNGGRNMSVHHINYQKSCGCDNTQFCIYVPLCMSCHGKSSNGNRWYWYSRFMTELALRNPNYYAYHIPVVYYDEPSYNYAYVFEKNRKKM